MTRSSTASAWLSRVRIRVSRVTPGWLLPRELIVVLLCVDTVALLTGEVATRGGVVRLDTAVYDTLGARSSTVADVVTELGSVQVAGTLLAFACLVAATTARRWWPLLLAAGNSLAASVIVLALKSAVGRTGPGLATNEDGYPGYLPSGHTAAAAVCLGTAVYLTWTAWRERPRPVPHRAAAEVGERPRPTADVSGRCTLIGLVVGAVVGSATVVTGNHWVSDVLAGLAVSAFVLVLGFATARRWSRRR